MIIRQTDKADNNSMPPMKPHCVVEQASLVRGSSWRWKMDEAWQRAKGYWISVNYNTKLLRWILVALIQRTTDLRRATLVLISLSATLYDSRNSIDDMKKTEWVSPTCHFNDKFNMKMNVGIFFHRYLCAKWEHIARAYRLEICL